MEAYFPGRCQPTVFGADSYDAAEDAEALHKAMEGAGTDEQTIIDILARRNIAQRLDIAERYKVMYGESIVKDLKSELRGHFEDVIVGLLTPLPEFYAKELHHAISGMGTDEGAIIEILCTLSRHGVAVISDTYQKKYERSLEDDLRGEASGYFKRLLVSLCQATQRETNDISEHLVMEDVQALLDAGENSWGTDESKFHEILMSRGTGHLAEVFKQYENVAGHDIFTAIKREFSGNLEKALLALAKCVVNRAEFFADRLYGAMHGMGTDDRTLIRIIVSRCEIDLADIKEEYRNKYGKTLEEKIEGECSGHYKKLLIALVA